MKASWLIVTGVVSFWLAGAVASAQVVTPQVMSPAQVAVSQPLSQGSGSDEDEGHKEHKPKHLPHQGKDVDHDDVLQSVPGPILDTKKKASFPGVGANGSAPPDTNMAVGPNHILQTVNARYAIYNKSGALISGPTSLGFLWAALGGGCAGGSGDVVAQYDKLADRFIVTQLGSVTSPFSECIAISQTPDPGGAYWLYSFSYGNALPDYPKFGVWPTATNGAYLSSYNMFTNAQIFTGAQICAFDRTKMLAGNPTAQSICFNISNDSSYLPSDLDGSTPPLDGTPGYFLNLETLSSLRMYTLSPNFANPGASVLTQVGPDIPVAAFAEACAPSDTCVPQSGTTTKLDALGDRVMYRLAFRNFGDHEAMVVNHSIVSGSSVGVRWYELRAPVSTSGAFSLFQQGTFAPDSTYRWMGSAAMDAAGDIAVGYSASSSSIHPAIRYTGRLVSDPLGIMGSEVSIIEGPGSQTGGLTRWGDYTAMRIDPSDDCTFWYTNEYLPSNGSFNWATAFASFKFASCNAPDFSISANPSSLTLTQGAIGTSTTTVTALNGFSGSVGLGVTGCPSGATCSLPTPVGPNPTATSTLTVTTTAGTSTGTYTLTITGTSGALVHTTTVSLTVNSSSTSAVNVALAANGGAAVASSAFSGAYPAASTINGDRKGLSWGNGGGWADGTPGVYPDTLEVDFNGSQTINEIDLFTVQDNYASPVDPTLAMTFSLYGLRDFEVQFWTGSAWAPIPGGTVTGNNRVWRQFTFAGITTTKIRVSITGTPDGYSRITEFEAYTGGTSTPDFSISANPSSLTLTQGAIGTSTTTVTALNGFSGSVGLGVTGCPSGATCSLPTPVSPAPTATSTLTVTTTAGTSTGTFTLTITGTSGALVHTTTVSLTVNAAGSAVNVALAANGGAAVASSAFSGAYPTASTINGDRKGLSWGNGGGWADGTPGVYPDTLEVDFNGSQTINEIDLFTVQDNYASPVDPTLAMTFSLYGLRDFEVQFWTGSAWAPIPGGTVTGNNRVWRQFTFAGITTTKIRVSITGTPDGYSRITEFEAYTGGTSTPDFSISANPSSLTLTQGAIGASTTTVTALNGFSGSVGLGVTGCPSGATCSLPTPVSPAPTATSTLTVTTTAGTSTGTFTLTITGTSGALVHTTTVSLTVNAAGSAVNVALAANGGAAVASSAFSGAYPAASTINGDRKGLSWGNGGGWADGTPGVYPDTLEVDFNGSQTINEIDLFTVQDNYASPVDPTLAMTFSLYGLRDFVVQYWTGSAWAPIPGGTVTGNNLVWRKFTFAGITTTKIRVSITGTADGYSRITEFEAYTGS